MGTDKGNSVVNAHRVERSVGASADRPSHGVRGWTQGERDRTPTRNASGAPSHLGRDHGAHAAASAPSRGRQQPEPGTEREVEGASGPEA